MPPKRTTDAPRAPRRSSGKVASRPRARKSASASPAPVALRGRLTSDHEKRELILAHSAMRRAKDPVQLMSVWAGVAASAVVVVIAWAWVFVPSLVNTLRGPLDPGTRALLHSANAAQEHASTYDLDQTELGKQIQQATADVDELTRKAELQAQALQVMASAIEGAASSTESRSDLFAPSPSKIPTE
ncbi:hypothetical protein KBC59_02160 [Patescibacteria group bacterium]|jgi:hypothetical protein|nr:hypothetical protein [Patescibacteria group bacterium]